MSQRCAPRGSVARSFSRAFPDGDASTRSTSDARSCGLKIKFERRMGDDYPGGVDLVSSGRMNVRALVSHRESLKVAPALFEALAQNRLGCVKPLLYPNGEDWDRLN